MLLSRFKKSRISLKQAVHLTQFELMIVNYYNITDQLNFVETFAFNRPKYVNDQRGVAESILTTNETL